MSPCQPILKRVSKGSLTHKKKGSSAWGGGVLDWGALESVSASQPEPIPRVHLVDGGPGPAEGLK